MYISLITFIPLITFIRLISFIRLIKYVCIYIFCMSGRIGYGTKTTVFGPKNRLRRRAFRLGGAAVLHPRYQPCS